MSNLIKRKLTVWPFELIYEQYFDDMMIKQDKYIFLANKQDGQIEMMIEIVPFLAKVYDKNTNILDSTNEHPELDMHYKMRQMVDNWLVHNLKSITPIDL
jgi:hypothetical protein